MSTDFSNQYQEAMRVRARNSLVKKDDKVIAAGSQERGLVLECLEGNKAKVRWKSGQEEICSGGDLIKIEG